MILDDFNVLILKINLKKNKKYIILIYFLKKHSQRQSVLTPSIATPNPNQPLIIINIKQL